MTDKEPMMDDDPGKGWWWRNCRTWDFSITFSLWPWPYELVRMDKEDDLFGGCRWLIIGPFIFTVSYTIGDASADGWQAWGALDEDEAWDRAVQFERDRKEKKNARR